MADYSDLKNKFKTDDTPTGDNYAELIDLAGSAKDLGVNAVVDNHDGSITINGTKLVPVNDNKDGTIRVNGSSYRPVIDNNDNTLTLNGKVIVPVKDNQDGTVTVNTQTYTPANNNNVVKDNHDGSILVNGRQYTPADVENVVKDNHDGTIKVSGASYKPVVDNDNGTITVNNITYTPSSVDDVNKATADDKLRLKGRRTLDQKMCVHAWGYQFQQDNINNNGRGFSLIKSHGFSYVRMGISWKSTETTAGNFNYEILDKLINMSTNSGLIPIILCSPDVPDFYASDTYDNNFSRFKKFYADVISHYKNKGIQWEGLNEPNSGVSWFKSDSSTDDFHQKLSVVTQSMALISKSIDPSSSFISGVVATNLWATGTNPWQEFVQKIMTDKVSKYSNYFSHHPYLLDKSPAYFYSQDSQIIYINNVLNNYNVDQKQAITEIGWTVTGDANKVDEETKATYLLQSIFMADQMNVDIIGVFNWYTLGPDDEYGKQNPSEVGYGIIASDMVTDLPAGLAISDAINKLKGFSFDFTEDTGNNDVIMHYINYYTNKHKIVYWSFDGDFHTNGSKGSTVSLPDSTVMAPKPVILDID